MSQTADIKAMLDWLASCPLATTLNNGDVVFSIEYLGADTGQMQFSLEATPTAMVLEQFFLGSRRAKKLCSGIPHGLLARGRPAGRKQRVLG